MAAAQRFKEEGGPHERREILATARLALHMIAARSRRRLEFQKHIDGEAFSVGLAIPAGPEANPLDCP
jgi:hypothetical protein